MSRSACSVPVCTAALAASLLLALGGCTSAASSGSTPNPSGPGSATSSLNPSASAQFHATTPPVTSGEPTADSPSPDVTAPVSSPAGSTAAALITGVRTATHPGYDRVVVDLSGPMPGYQVSYVNSLVFDGSGAAVPLSGSAFLRIRLAPANAHDPTTGVPVFPLGGVTHLGLPTVTGYAQTGDFEGVVSFGLALSHKAGFHVFTLTGPSRIVVDVAN
jgi:hypothetical protein